MIRTLGVVMATLLVISAARAEQYWIAYEGNDFPENEGWTRIWFDPQAERWIEDDALVIDSRASVSTCEWYEWHPDVTDPGTGEVFIAQWRLLVEEVTIGPYDPTVGIFSDDRWAVGFHFGEERIESVFEIDVSAAFEPGLFHDFELRSPDMRTYELYIDGSLAIQGSFWLSLMSSQVGWGDTIQGAASLTRWDYFRFGVVPEPSPALLLTVAVLAKRNRI
jgi:hypothetical protein